MDLQRGAEWKWWILLAICLFFFSFGLQGLLFTIYALFFLTGCVVIAFYYGRQLSNRILQMACRQCEKPLNGLIKVKSNMEPSTKIKNFDKRMTGASVIDDVLKEVLEYTVRDYIKPWYRQLSDHDDFLVDTWQCVQKVVITFASRSKSVNWMPYFTQRLVDDFGSHIRLYRRAADKAQGHRKEEQYCQLLEDAFFDGEVEMEDNMCRDLVCTSPPHERQYLQDLCEVLLYLLMPKDDFHSKPFRYIIREILVNGIFIPTVDLLSDPDYINQYLAWMCSDTSFSRETFLTVIRSSDLAAELEAVRDKVEEDIARWRSRDTGGSEDTMIKQNLNSLVFLRDTCSMRLKHLRDGGTDSEIEEPDYLRYQSLYVMTLDDLLNNNTALQAFMEFISDKGGQQYLFFYLNVEGFRTAAAQQIKEQCPNAEPDLNSLKRAAIIIYDQYLAEKGISRIRVEPEFIKGITQKIKSKTFSEDVFDVVQARVYQILHTNYYEEFLQSPAYVRLLSELGLLQHDRSHQPDADAVSLDDDIAASVMATSLGSPDNVGDVIDDGDSLSLDSQSSITSSGSASHSLSGEINITAQITQTGVVKENNETYAVFAVTVKRKMPNSEDEEIWDVYRRYSDFHDLNMILVEKFPELQGPVLPGKTVLKNMGKEFLEKRRKALDNYLRALLKPELWQKIPGLEELMTLFLAQGLWEKKYKSDFSKKMDTFVNPLRIAVKNVPDGIGKVFNMKGASDDGTGDGQASKVGAGLDLEAADNIPLRIMLLLLDEVFDLRLKNQWLRRRMVSILRQLIKATFGDMINRKIVDHVDFMTSAEQMAEYISAFRNSFWPGGVLAEPRPPRDEATKMRTRVLCKAKMFGSVPDEMRTMMGSDSIRHGIFLVFNMFQHKTLNKRFLYVFLEGVLETLFLENRFHQLFRKQHSRSQRVKDALSRREALSSNSKVHRRPLKR